MMKEFLERLDLEKLDLKEKIGKLDDFIEINPIFIMISEIQKVLLRTQLDAMKMYLFILEQRIIDLSK